jgi:hypothetical protein
MRFAINWLVPEIKANNYKHKFICMKVRLRLPGGTGYSTLSSGIDDTGT